MRIPNIRFHLLIAVTAALASPLANALVLTDIESLDAYAGLVSVTVNREGPTFSATHSGTASPSSTFVMAWMGGDSDDAHSLSLASGVPSLSIDFGSLLAGSAPSSLGRHSFNLALDPIVLDINGVDLGGKSLGDVASVLALANGAGDYASWSEVVTRGVFVATYHLFLFDVSGNGSSSSGSSLVEPTVETGFGPNVDTGFGSNVGIGSSPGAAAVAVPEPDLLALIGIGLAGLAASKRRKVIRPSPAQSGGA